MTIDELDAMPAADAAEVFRSCCGSSRWVSEMVERRPFGSVARVMSAADEVWRSTGKEDLYEAFAHHPRIGESRAAVARSSRAESWSSGEQAGVESAPAGVIAALAEANRIYEERFGHIYLVCATGMSAEQMLALARERLSNDPEAELRVAAEEQRRITRLRLRKFFGEDQ